MKVKFLIILPILFITGVHFHFQNTCGVYQQTSAIIGEEKVALWVADTECKRTLGLSGHESLKDGEGMLFVFDEESVGHGIWMKRMNFPIDILWANAGGKIVGMERLVAPETYPQIFGAQFISKYAVELPAGYLDARKITLDNFLILESVK